MDAIQALILGIVEGLTEFLPISSTAHLMLAADLMKLEKDDFRKTFEIAIQSGAILSVVLLYWRKFLVEWRVLLRVIVAFVPTAVIGLTVYKIVKEHFLDNTPLTLSALIIGGVLLIVFERVHREKPGAATDLATIPLWKCLVIGICQTLAFIPGVSRAAATILGGLALGLTRKASVEFSFLLAVPTVAAATARILYDEWRDHGTLPVEHAHLLLIGLVTSFVAAALTIKFLLHFIRTHTFEGFGYYRIALAIVVGLVLVNY